MPDDDVPISTAARPPQPRPERRLRDHGGRGAGKILDEGDAAPHQEIRDPFPRRERRISSDRTSVQLCESEYSTLWLALMLFDGYQVIK